MLRIILVLLILFVTFISCATDSNPVPDSLKYINEETIIQDVRVLSADDMEGRAGSQVMNLKKNGKSCTKYQNNVFFL